MMVDKMGEYRSSPNQPSFLTLHGACLVAPDAILHARRHGRSRHSRLCQGSSACDRLVARDGEHRILAADYLVGVRYVANPVRMV